MDAEALATALVSGGRSESEKLRLIRTSFPAGGGHLSLAGVAHVQRCLGADRRLAKLSVEFANASRNKEFAISQLSSANTLTPRLVATRFHWLYTDDMLLNENFLLSELPKMSHSTRLKVLYAIGTHVHDLELGDKLWRAVRARCSLRYSNRLLAACSNELIIGEMTASIVVHLTDAQMLRIIHKRFDSGVELLRTLRLMRKGNKLKQNVDFVQAMNLVLLKDIKKGFDIMVETDMNITFGVNRTRSLLKVYSACGGGPVATERIVKYANHLHQKALRRYAPTALYLQCFVEENRNYNPESEYEVRGVMSWLAGFHQLEKRRFLEALYQKKYNKSIMEVPMKVFPEMLYVLNESERTGIVKRRLEEKKFSLARPYFLERGDYFWRSMLPCNESFPYLRNLLDTEPKGDSRGILYSLMISSAVMQRDAKALEEQMEFVVKRCRNETHGARDPVIDAVDRYYESEDRVRANIWPSVKELFEIFLLDERRERWAMFDILFGVLRSIDPRDSETVKDLAGVLSKTHLNHSTLWQHSFADDLENTPRQHCELIIKQMLDDQEVYLGTKQTNGYVDASHMWRAFSTLQGLKLQVDLTQYPNNLAFLKYLVSSGEKIDDCMLDVSTLNDAYRLIQDHIDKDDLIGNNIESHKNTDLDRLRKQIREANDAGKIDLKTILNDEPATEVALIRKFSELLAASSAITPEILQEALDLSKDSGHRVAATQFLAMCMPLDGFMAHFSKLIPTEANTDAGDIDSDLLDSQKALIAAIPGITDSATALQILAGFMQGEFLSLAVGAFNYHCSRSPPEIVLPFLKNNLTKCEENARKHFLRWYFVYAAEDDDKLDEIIASEKSCPTKVQLLQIVYRRIEDCGDQAWPTLKSCLDKDIVGQYDLQIVNFLFRDESVDDRLSQHLSNFFEVIVTYGSELPEYLRDKFDYVFARTTRVISRLPPHLTQFVCAKALDQELINCDRAKHALSYVEHFALYNFPQNFSFLESQLNSRLVDEAKFIEDNVRAIVKSICTNVVIKKRTQGTDASSVLRALGALISNHLDGLFLDQAYIDLTQIIVERIPSKGANEQVFASFIREYTRKGLALLCERLDMYGNQLLAILTPLITEAIQPFVVECPMYRAQMLEVYGSDSPVRYAWFLIDCLPPTSSEHHGDGEDVYEGFISAIKTGTDRATRILLNIKLRNIKVDDD